MKILNLLESYLNFFYLYYYIDMKALDIMVGNKKFVFSDKEPSDVDFVIFGMFAQILYNDRGPFNAYLKSDCQNLLKHTLNIKQIYWPDWEENTLMARKKIIS